MIVKMFQPQFADLVAAGEKRQTIRPVPKRMPKAGDVISCRRWEDKPYRSRHVSLYQGEIERVEYIEIYEYGMAVRGRPFTGLDSALECHDTGRFFHELPDRKELDDFAMADGFSCWLEMKAWFSKHHKGLPFSGILILWK